MAEEIFVSAILLSLFSLAFFSFYPKNTWGRGGNFPIGPYRRGWVNNFQYIALLLSLSLKGYSRNISINHNSFLQVKYVDVEFYL